MCNRIQQRVNPMADTPGKLLSSLAESERQQPKLGSCVGVFYQLFDWNRRFSGKSALSSKLLPAERLKHAPKKLKDEKLPMARLLLIADERRSERTSMSQDDASSEQMPGVVARLMGLDSMPAQTQLVKSDEEIPIHNNSGQRGGVVEGKTKGSLSKRMTVEVAPDHFKDPKAVLPSHGDAVVPTSLSRKGRLESASRNPRTARFQSHADRKSEEGLSQEAGILRYSLKEDTQWRATVASSLPTTKKKHSDQSCVTSRGSVFPFDNNSVCSRRESRYLEKAANSVQILERVTSDDGIGIKKHVAPLSLLPINQEASNKAGTFKDLGRNGCGKEDEISGKTVFLDTAAESLAIETDGSSNRVTRKAHENRAYPKQNGSDNKSSQAVLLDNAKAAKERLLYRWGSSESTSDSSSQSSSHWTNESTATSHSSGSSLLNFFALKRELRTWAKEKISGRNLESAANRKGKLSDTRSTVWATAVAENETNEAETVVGSKQASYRQCVWVSGEDADETSSRRLDFEADSEKPSSFFSSVGASESWDRRDLSMNSVDSRGDLNFQETHMEEGLQNSSGWSCASFSRESRDAHLRLSSRKKESMRFPAKTTAAILQDLLAALHQSRPLKLEDKLCSYDPTPQDSPTFSSSSDQCRSGGALESILAATVSSGSFERDENCNCSAYPCAVESCEAIETRSAQVNSNSFSVDDCCYQHQQNEQRQQPSPVSILDSPFKDESCNSSESYEGTRDHVDEGDTASSLGEMQHQKNKIYSVVSIPRPTIRNAEEYVSEIVEAALVMSKYGCKDSCCEMDEALFNRLEEAGKWDGEALGSCQKRKLLFDCVNEAMSRGSCFCCWCRSCAEDMERGVEMVARDVVRQIHEWREMEGMTEDAVVEKEMMGMRWMMDMGDIAEEIGSSILSGLMEELILFIYPSFLNL